MYNHMEGWPGQFLLTYIPYSLLSCTLTSNVVFTIFNRLSIVNRSTLKYQNICLSFKEWPEILWSCILCSGSSVLEHFYNLGELDFINDVPGRELQEDWIREYLTEFNRHTHNLTNLIVKGLISSDPPFTEKHAV